MILTSTKDDSDLEEKVDWSSQWSRRKAGTTAFPGELEAAGEALWERTVGWVIKWRLMGQNCGKDTSIRQ